MTALLKPTGSPAERFTSRDPDDKTRFAYQYHLEDNVMALQQVMMQDHGAAPKTVFKADDAQTH